MSQSHIVADALLGPGNAGNPPANVFLGRSGYGPRLPLLTISPFACKNFADHSMTDQSSGIRFIEDDWDLGRIGDQSFDAIAGTITHLFDFAHGPHPHRLFLDPTSGRAPVRKKRPRPEGWRIPQHPPPLPRLGMETREVNDR